MAALTGAEWVDVCQEPSGQPAEQLAADPA
jgi:hypothetical protein